eukprot:TRINITY_DN14046_c0_g1_i1.p1 TRINITY_DN14046_c0_g1~~TRINITY_DN14046_c0_g1_i1.p1  ORF type:complete len:687 (+),score=123.83 TRINITY_DN14046_c0_g1_i1:130-2190(+)
MFAGGDGRLNLEFQVSAEGISDEDLAARLQQNAGRLEALLRHPVLDVQVGEERGWPEDVAMMAVPSRAGGPGGPPPSRPLSAMQRGPGDMNHPTMATSPTFLGEGSYWDHRKGSRIVERREEEDRRSREQQEQAATFKARPVPASTNAPRFQAMRAAAEAARAQSLLERQAAASERAASAVPLGHTAASRGRAISPEGKHANAPGAGRRRAQSADWRSSLRGSSPGRKSDPEDDAFEPAPPPPFRARPVPWKVSAPLYDQMLVEEQRSRRTRQTTRSRGLMRASSLPPRLEAIRARLSGDVEGHGRVHRASTPVPPARLATGAHASQLVNRPLRAEQPLGPPMAGEFGGIGALLDSAENIARDAATDSMRAAAAGPGVHGWGGATVYGSNYGLSHFARQADPPQKRPASAGASVRTPSGIRQQQQQSSASKVHHDTTEVPDFATLHQKEREKLERRKFQNRYVTQPDPFVFQAPTRARHRQPPMPQDPSDDYRWQRSPAVGSSPKGANRPRSAERRGAATSPFLYQPQAFDRPPPSVVAPPRSTEKTKRAMQHRARDLQERRERERQERLELEQANVPSVEMKCRVKKAIGVVESLDEKLERITTDKRQNAQRVVREKQRALQAIKERVNRRPLLMEQTDALARARRRALFRVRSTLEAAGLTDIKSHFLEEELDEMDFGAEGYAM